MARKRKQRLIDPLSSGRPNHQGSVRYVFNNPPKRAPKSVREMNRIQTAQVPINPTPRTALADPLSSGRGNHQGPAHPIFNN